MQAPGLLKTMVKPSVLHYGGIIIKGGYATDVKVDLAGKLTHFCLPIPAKDDEAIKKSIKAVFTLKQLVTGNKDIGLLITAAAVRAIISPFLPITESYFIVGETGTRKSALAAVIQSFFGAGFADQTQLPAEWEDTECALKQMTNIIKNALLVIDEFTPTRINEKELSKKAEGVLR